MALLFRAVRASGLLVALLILAPGCALSVSSSVAPNVDSKGRPGGEGRVEGSATFGLPEIRGYTSLATGGGYLPALRAGYGMLAPEIGVEGGVDVRWSAGVFYAPRFYGSPVQVLNAGGAAGQVLFRVRKGANNQGLAIGPRLSVEGASPPPLDASPYAADVPTALFQLGFVLRWLAFDTIGEKIHL
jgi:hypothetical protein